MSAAMSTPTAEQPEEPAFVAAAKIVLHAAEHDEGGNAEEIAGLVAIWVRAQSRVRYARRAARFRGSAGKDKARRAR